MEDDGEIDITIFGGTTSGGFNSTLYGGTDDARRIDGDDASFLLNATGSQVAIVVVSSTAVITPARRN